MVLKKMKSDISASVSSLLMLPLGIEKFFQAFAVGISSGFVFFYWNFLFEGFEGRNVNLSS